MAERKRFNDKVCLVSGGGSGIGRAACLRFGAEGGLVTVVDLNVDHGNQVCAGIVNAGGHAIFAKADISKPGAVIAAIDTAVGEWGKVDVVLNDAAMMTFKPIVDLPDEESTTF